MPGPTDAARYQQGERRPVLLTDAELELVVIALAELTVERRRFAVNARRTDPKAADNALVEVLGAGILGNRLSLEHMDRARPSPSTLAAELTCAECGGRGGRHEIDCDLRPIGDASPPEPRP